MGKGYRWVSLKGEWGDLLRIKEEESRNVYLLGNQLYPVGQSFSNFNMPLHTGALGGSVV